MSTGTAEAAAPLQAAAAATPVSAAALRPVVPALPVPALHHLVARYFRATRAPDLVVGGTQPLALVYLLVALLVAAPRRQAVVVVDLEARFDKAQLLGVQGGVMADEASPEAPAFPASAVTEDDLRHVFVVRADPRWHAPLAEVVAAAEQHVLYGGAVGQRDHNQQQRPWWGTLVVGGGGGGSSGAALATGFNGWLRVDAAATAWEAPHARQRRLLALLGEGEGGDEQRTAAYRESVVCEAVSWVASSPWGSFTFRLSTPAKGCM